MECASQWKYTLFITQCMCVCGGGGGEAGSREGEEGEGEEGEGEEGEGEEGEGREKWGKEERERKREGKGERGEGGGCRKLNGSVRLNDWVIKRCLYVFVSDMPRLSTAVKEKSQTLNLCSHPESPRHCQELMSPLNQDSELGQCNPATLIGKDAKLMCSR